MNRRRQGRRGTHGLRLLALVLCGLAFAGCEVFEQLSGDSDDPCDVLYHGDDPCLRDVNITFMDLGRYRGSTFYYLEGTPDPGRLWLAREWVIVGDSWRNYRPHATELTSFEVRAWVDANGDRICQGPPEEPAWFFRYTTGSAKELDSTTPKSAEGCFPLEP